MKPEDLAYEAVSEWKKRALEAEAEVKRLNALLCPEATDERSRRIDAALDRAESPSGAINEGDAPLLASELRNLRARCLGAELARSNAVRQLNEWDAEVKRLQTERDRLRVIVASHESILRALPGLED